MPFDVLIDGYNLLHAAGLAKARYAPGELQRRRAKMLQKLVELVDPAALSRTTVVFDARRDPPAESPPESSRSLSVLFAPKHQEADDLIEELLAKHSSPKQVLVVSSDHRLHKAARRRGATAIDSDLFLDQIEQRAPAGRPDRGRTTTKQSPTSDQETIESLRIAAEIELRKTEEDSHDTAASRAVEPNERAQPDELSDPAFWERRIQDGHDKL